MQRSLITLSFMGLSAAALFAAEPAKPAAPAKEPAAKVATKETKETAKKPEAKSAEEKTEKKKPGELSESDKALMEHAGKESAKLSDAQKKSLLERLNTGDDKALESIPGIGEAKIAHLKKARPLKSVDDLIMVKGVGEKTFDGIVKWTADGMKEEAPEPKKEPSKEPEKKKETKKEPTKPAEPVKPAVAPTKKPA